VIPGRWRYVHRAIDQFGQVGERLLDVAVGRAEPVSAA